MKVMDSVEVVAEAYIFDIRNVLEGWSDAAKEIVITSELVKIATEVAHVRRKGHDLQ